MRRQIPPPLGVGMTRPIKQAQVAPRDLNHELLGQFTFDKHNSLAHATLKSWWNLTVGTESKQSG
jgi:hypothetical protein